MNQVRVCAEKLLGQGDFLRVADGPFDLRRELLAKRGLRVLAMVEPILRQAEAEAQNLETSAEAAGAARLEVEAVRLLSETNPASSLKASVRAATFRNRALALLAKEGESADGE